MQNSSLTSPLHICLPWSWEFWPLRARPVAEIKPVSPFWTSQYTLLIIEGKAEISSPTPHPSFKSFASYQIWKGKCSQQNSRDSCKSEWLQETEYCPRGSRVVRWWRIHQPIQERQIWPLIREDLTGWRATKPVRHNYWTCALEPRSHSCWSQNALARACALQEESSHNENSTVMKSSPNSLKPEKSLSSNKDPTQPKNHN